MDAGVGDDDVMGINDEDQPPPNNSLRLELSNDNSNDRIADVGTVGISFGEDEESAEATLNNQSSKKKRKSADNQIGEKKKKRKVLSGFGVTELSSAYMRTMLADTSKIVTSFVHPATWVPGQTMKTAHGFSDRQLIRRHAPVEKLLQRPCLADNGQLAPQLLERWARNTAHFHGEPFPYKMRLDERNEKGNDGEKEKDVVASMEKARRADDDGTSEEEDNEYPEVQGGDDNVFPADDDENKGIPFDDSMDDQIEMNEDGVDDSMGFDSKLSSL